ncbi:MAG TPA: IPT/TIG domain-containing protein [Candidatus Acidoferrales bacterium]|nr:IPT/TIG domain-containing protein [Candidatus Acidoferrales bacterium]
MREGSVGTSVTISGSDFGSSQGSSTVTFGGTSAGTAPTWTATSIVIPVPSGAPVGSDAVVVTVAGVASNNDKTFTVTGPAPNIASLSPNTGPATTLVTITGTNFGSTQGTSTVTFTGIATNPISWNSTTIVAPVPAGAATGNVIVTVNGVASNGKMFTVPTGTNVYYYLDDMLGSGRVITTSAGAVCYDADFYPFGGERVVADNCGVEQDYKFEGKERDAETGDDNFGARYYSNRLGRWLSADWSSVPAPVPYANLTNPQTLNLYAMVSDNPESFADLDGHDEIKNTGVCEGDKVCSGEGPDLLIEAGEFLRNVTDEDSNGQTEPAAEQKADDEAAAAKESAAATAPAARIRR